MTNDRSSSTHLDGLNRRDRPAFRDALAQADAQRRATPDRRLALERERATIEREITNITAGLAQLGPIPEIVEKMHALQASRADLDRQWAALGTTPRRWDTRAIERRLTALVADWQTLLLGDLAKARELLRLLLPQRLRFTPQATGGYEITAPVAFGGLLALAVAGLPHERVPPG